MNHRPTGEGPVLRSEVHHQQPRRGQQLPSRLGHLLGRGPAPAGQEAGEGLAQHLQGGGAVRYHAIATSMQLQRNCRIPLVALCFAEGQVPLPTVLHLRSGVPRCDTPDFIRGRTGEAIEGRTYSHDAGIGAWGGAWERSSCPPHGSSLRLQAQAQAKDP